jgi:N-hydroxyarylamine O-acetyltransferase
LISTSEALAPAALDAYLARIGHDGPREPTLAVLRSLHLLHPMAIAFEAVDPLLGRPVSLAPDAVFDKLVTQGRGGYCYEQNGLFKRALTALGFQVEGLLARVRWMMPPEPLRPPTHMALRVMIDGEAWLADVGFGGMTLTAPVRLEPDLVQQTPHGRFRLTPEGEDLQLQFDMGDGWAPVYQLSLSGVPDGDFELPNWWSSAHPSSYFRNNLIACRVTPQARFNLSGNVLAVRGHDGAAEKRVLDVEALRSVLIEVFGLPHDASVEHAAMLERVGGS